MPEMQDHELYRRILGIETPWFVDSVDLKLESGEIHVHLRHDDAVDWPCPECGTTCTLYDHQPERRWRHLDTCQSIRSCTPNRHAASAATTG
jgi:transposase